MNNAFVKIPNPWNIVSQGVLSKEAKWPMQLLLCRRKKSPLPIASTCLIKNKEVVAVH